MTLIAKINSSFRDLLLETLIVKLNSAEVSSVKGELRARKKFVLIEAPFLTWTRKY